MGAMGFGLGMGGLSLASGLAGNMQKSNAQKAQAAQMQAQAENTRTQARLEGQRAEREAAETDRRKSRIRREFTDVMARNQSVLGAGNVDMTSGSALDTASGNINRFAADMGENSYARAMKLWEGRQRQTSLNYQADAQDASASWLKRSAGNFGTSLLTATLGAIPSAVQGYSLAGGKLSSIFGSGGTKPSTSQAYGWKPGTVKVPPSILSLYLGEK